jgi:hypothetical protein
MIDLSELFGDAKLAAITITPFNPISDRRDRSLRLLCRLRQNPNLSFWQMVSAFLSIAKKR